MFELNGYWQRFGTLKAGSTDWAEACVKCRGTMTGGSGDESLALSTKAAERYLAIPTFIRLGKNVQISALA